MQEFAERVVFIFYLAFFLFLLAFCWFIPLWAEDKSSDKTQYDDNTVYYYSKSGK